MIEAHDLVKRYGSGLPGSQRRRRHAIRPWRTHHNQDENGSL